ncbi:MAG: hypothetical protein J6A09_01050 [Alphaproteobacteria bacterium]|nr:hypothetical protein [Alphaproteobacteria bacterium]
MLDYFLDDNEIMLKKNEKKKKLHELLDKYGSVEEIEKKAIGADGYEYMFANTNNLIDEVLQERRSQQSSLSPVRKDTPQKKNTLLPNDEDFSLEGLTLSDRQRKAIKNLDMANQLTVIKALREQQNVEKPHQKVEEEIENMTAENKPDDDFRIHKAEKQYAENVYTGVKNDADKKEELKIDYSKYGNGFTKGFIDELVSDIEFNNIINEYLAPNEGGYKYDEDDSGGETNMGISKNTHKNENIKDMTRERANAIFYRDYYKWNGLAKLPYKIRGFIVDFGVCSQPLMAIKMTHRVLGIPEGNIIGKTTLDKFKKFTQKDYEDFLEKYRTEMIKYFKKVAEADPKKKKFLKGWINRAKRAHLSN